MKKLRTALAFVSALVVAASITTPVTAVQAAVSHGGVPFVLVVSRKLDLRNLTMAEVRRVFGGEPTFVGSKRLIPFNYAAKDPIREAFDRIALGLTPQETARYWVDRRVRGQGTPPRTVPNPTFMVAVAERLVGAIGYLPVNAVPSSALAKVRVLKVDGIAPGAPNYPLFSTELEKSK